MTHLKFMCKNPKCKTIGGGQESCEFVWSQENDVFVASVRLPTLCPWHGSFFRGRSPKWKLIENDNKEAKATKKKGKKV